MQSSLQVIDSSRFNQPTPISRQMFFSFPGFSTIEKILYTLPLLPFRPSFCFACSTSVFPFCPRRQKGLKRIICQNRIALTNSRNYVKNLIRTKPVTGHLNVWPWHCHSGPGEKRSVVIQIRCTLWDKWFWMNSEIL
jgi:hypothetical protein